MSANTQDPGHAVRPDGSLKDTSEMNWTYDKDETRVVLLDVLGDQDVLTAHLGTKRKAAPTEDQRITHVNVIDDVDNASSYDSDDSDEDSSIVPIDDLVSDSDVSMEPQDVGDLASTCDYESIRAMADADHEALNFKPKAKCTQDIQVIFKRQKAYRHPVTGKISDGHLCMVCKKHDQFANAYCKHLASSQNPAPSSASQLTHIAAASPRLV
ncbi:hypothetical protein H4582DRAFT_2053736 [Lactarius indigo]|nr:hypothetical protein H4582DRAFT_2053736 [Lactarius indigo]